MDDSKAIEPQTGSISVIQDEQGILFLGESNSIEQLLKKNGLSSREVTTKALKVAGTAMQQAASSAQQSGRWVKLTKESAELLAQYGKSGAVQKGVVQAANGRTVKWLEFINPSQMLTPSMAAGVGGMMAQVALEQAIQEITDYLKTIDAKVDKLLQDQKDAVIADLLGVSLELDEAFAVMQSTGGVSVTAWDKIAPCATITSRSLSYALTKLKNGAETLDATANIDDIIAQTVDFSADLEAWLGVIARSIQARDKFSSLELERAFAETPEVMEEHRQGIIAARKKRLSTVRDAVSLMQGTFIAVSARLRDGKLFHPHGIDKAIERLAAMTEETRVFAEHLDIEIEQHTIERARRWDKIAGEALGNLASDVQEGATDLGSALADNAHQLGGQIAEGSQELGKLAEKGAGELSAAASQGVKALGDALSNIDLKAMGDALPLRFPFGRK